MEPAALRKKALPGWRLHGLHGTSMLSLSLDMNFRILLRLDGQTIIVHRVVKHDRADRSDINRNVRSPVLAELSTSTLLPSDIYDALRSLNIPEHEAREFRHCRTEDDILSAVNNVNNVSKRTADLAVELYEISSIIIPQARFRLLERNDEFATIAERGGNEWEIYLHPSQSHVVKFASGLRHAVEGSAGTGKTICAWHRTKHLIEIGCTVGFVSPNRSVLSISKANLLRMIGDKEDGSFYFVPKNPTELIDLASSVDHIIIDEAQEIPVTWLQRLAKAMRLGRGITLFYDINQLGGHIKKGDTRRYQERIVRWNTMMRRFPKLSQIKFSINFRNSREISEYYQSLLSDSLSFSYTEVPVFEAGKVIEHKIKDSELNNFLASLLYRILQKYPPHDIGVVILDRPIRPLFQALMERNLPVTRKVSDRLLLVANAARIRGHERQVVVAVGRTFRGNDLKVDGAIHVYIALSRAVRTLIALRVEAS